MLIYLQDFMKFLRPELLLKYIAYIKWHKIELDHRSDVKDDLSEKMIVLYMCTCKSLFFWWWNIRNYTLYWLSAHEFMLHMLYKLTLFIYFLMGIMLKIYRATIFVK